MLPNNHHSYFHICKLGLILKRGVPSLYFWDIKAFPFSSSPFPTFTALSCDQLLALSTESPLLIGYFINFLLLTTHPTTYLHVHKSFQFQFSGIGTFLLSKTSSMLDLTAFPLTPWLCHLPRSPHESCYISSLGPKPHHETKQHTYICSLKLFPLCY